MISARLSTLAAAAATAAILVTGGAADAAPAKYARHAAAAADLHRAGVAWSSTGRCSDWNKRSCTSFTRINKATVAGAIALKRASRCHITITGGTEVGHARGRFSHRNGYKVDVALTSCVNRYVTTKLHRAGKRGDGAALYKSRSGNLYAREGSHWDITYFHGRV